MENPKRRSSDIETVNKWWHSVRPYWHILSFIMTITAIVSVNWAKVSAYDGRLIALELWRIEISKEEEAQGKDIAVVKSQVEDIHDYLIPKK